MPSSTAAVPLTPAGRLGEAWRREPRYAGGAVFLLLLALPLLAAMALDGRTLHGDDLWTKPLRFAFALSLYLATLAWYAGWLPAGVTGRPWYRAFAGATVAAAAAEMVWIVGAAAYGTESHFNTRIPVLNVLYPLMGLIAVFLTAASLVFGVLILRDGGSRLHPAFRLSVGLGLILTFVLTVAVAGYMAQGAGHAVGHLSGTATVPVMGWARDGGDLRVAHFFATHALHGVPVVGFLASRSLSHNAARLAVWGAALLYAAFVVAVFAQAVAGRPFLPLAG